MPNINDTVTKKYDLILIYGVAKLPVGITKTHDELVYEATHSINDKYYDDTSISYKPGMSVSDIQEWSEIIQKK